MLPADDESALIRRCADSAGRLCADLLADQAGLDVAATRLDPRVIAEGRALLNRAIDAAKTVEEMMKDEC